MYSLTNLGASICNGTLGHLEVVSEIFSPDLKKICIILDNVSGAMSRAQENFMIVFYPKALIKN